MKLRDFVVSRPDVPRPSNIFVFSAIAAPTIDQGRKNRN